MNKKVKIARLSILSNTLLILMKIIAGICSGSVSIISEAIHSGLDLAAAIIAFFSVKISDNPPDKEHPYGHGKYENVSGVIEAILIFIAAFWIIYEAIKKITDKSPVEALVAGSAVMLISAIINTFVSKSLYKVARETDSIALEADALHLKTDVYTSLGVSAGLLLMWITGFHFLDPIIAIFVAILILAESYNLLNRAFSPLVDISLSKEEQKTIEDTISEFSLSFHNLRTRRAGNYKFADLHLEMKPDLSLEKVHCICDQIEENLKKRIPHIDVNIHIEPAEGRPDEKKSAQN